MVKESWLDRLSNSLDAAAGSQVRQDILQGSQGLSSASSPAVKARWVDAMLPRLEAQFEPAACRQILSACSCTFSQEIIQRFKLVYERTGSLEDLLTAMRDEQRESILARLGDGPDLRRMVESEPFMHSPRLCEDGSILHTGRPYHPRQYLQAGDAQTRRQHMCHCGWINGSRSDIPLTFCNCGTGFYRKLWESLVGAPVEAEVVSSVFSGGAYCQVMVRLPQ